MGRRARLLCALAVMWGGGAAAPVAAQTDAPPAEGASLVGTVFDSTAMTALAGARVAVIGTSVVGDADGAGRFRLTKIPPGTHWVSFFHPRLQALGVSPPSKQVTFRSGETVEVELAVPSEETLLVGWCMAEQPGPGYAAVAGVVTDSLTGVPMPRAVVTATPVMRGPGSPRPIEVRTDDAGYYRICTLPAGVEMRLQAHFGRSAGRSVELVARAGTATTRDLMLLMSAQGTLVGFVRDYATGEPIPGVEVSVLGTTSSTLTDAQGHFLLDDLPPGRHLVKTNHIAYEPRTDSVTVFSQETVDIEVRLTQEPIDIPGLVVTARTRFGRTSLAGDAKRADFISREQIERLLPRVTATVDLLRNVNAPGLRIRDVYIADPITGVATPSLCIEVSRRSGGEGCMPAAVFINDVVVPFPDQTIRDLDPNVIDRIEVLSPIDAQFQFGSLAGNGAILIYTR